MSGCVLTDCEQLYALLAILNEEEEEEKKEEVPLLVTEID